MYLKVHQWCHNNMYSNLELLPLMYNTVYTKAALSPG